MLLNAVFQEAIIRRQGTQKLNYFNGLIIASQKAISTQHSVAF